MTKEEDPLNLRDTHARPRLAAGGQPDPLLRVLVDVATAIAERKRLERADDADREVEVDE